MTSEERIKNCPQCGSRPVMTPGDGSWNYIIQCGDCNFRREGSSLKQAINHWQSASVRWKFCSLTPPEGVEVIVCDDAGNDAFGTYSAQYGWMSDPGDDIHPVYWTARPKPPGDLNEH